MAETLVLASRLPYLVIVGIWACADVLMCIAACERSSRKILYERFLQLNEGA